MGKFRASVIWVSVIAWSLLFGFGQSFAQDGVLELTLDVNSSTISLPKLFKPNIDLSGRGFSAENSWPSNLAGKEAIARWDKDIGWTGIYRLQYSLWEISALAKDKQEQDRLLANYESIIKKISDSGGIVIVDIFGTPAGMGSVLDKKSPPRDIKAFQELVRGIIRDLSCRKKYNIWYEVWNAPDLDDFFLGRKQEYLNLYRSLAEDIEKLKREGKVYIPIGGPSTSWWFQGTEGNTIATPERGLIYELIKFCYQYHLPLDFVSWHGYSTDPQVEKERTIYKKNAVSLIRDWLTYFNFERATPLVVDEWNYDRSGNVLAERKERSYIAASYIPARISNMYEAGIDYQVYFCLEDFHDNKEPVVRNLGAFYIDPEYTTHKSAPKAIYNVFRLMNMQGSEMFTSRILDEFIGAIATKTQEGFTLLIYNYSDPEAAINFFSRNFAVLDMAEKRAVLNLINTGKFSSTMHKQIELATLHVTKRLAGFLREAQDLTERTEKAATAERQLKIILKGLKDSYSYQRYSLDSACGLSCDLAPVEEKDISSVDPYQETVNLKPYSVQMIVLKKKPAQVVLPEELPQEAKEKEDAVSQK